MNTLAVSITLNGDGRIGGLSQELLGLRAKVVMPWQWIVLTAMTSEQLKIRLQRHIDPSDRLMVARIDSAASQNLINDIRLE
jgi:hypothetical protein